MFNTNPFGRQPPTMVVDKILGKSYHVVKAIYLNLDVLYSLDQNTDLNFIVEHFDTIYSVSLIKDHIANIGNNIEEILKASSYAQQAKLSAESALKSQQASQTILSKNQEIEGYFQKLLPDLISISNNITDVITTAGNINSINNVASDLRGLLLGDMSNDLGMVGEDDDGVNTVVTGGNIKKVADDIASVRTAADNIEDIVQVATSLDRLPEIKDDFVTIALNTLANANKAEQQANIAKSFSTAAESYATQAKASLLSAASSANTAQLSETQVTSILEEVKELKNATDTAKIQAEQAKSFAESYRDLAQKWASFDGLVNEEKGSALYYANKAKDSATLASTYLAQVNKAKDTAIQLIQSLQATSISQIQEEGTKQISAVTSEGTKQVNAVSTEGNAQIELAKAEVVKATEQANIASSKAEEASQKANLSKDWASKLDGPVADGEFSAKYYAQQAASGQLQSNWLETDPESKSFIKNKPEIYTKSLIDSKLGSVYVYKGSVASKTNLPSADQQVGWTYNVQDTGANFSWTGTEWDELGATIDLSLYATISSMNSALALKLDLATYNNDKSTFALKTEVQVKADKSYVDSALAQKQPTGDYATNESLTSGLATKANISDIADMLTKTEAKSTYLGLHAKADTALTADSVAWENVTGKEKVRTTDVHITMNDFGGPIDLGMIGE